ncbi:hypothetical protein EC988_005627 [Linderina pennispora]|nr:hypothetical protein EC988_005627 [Linderina pennispora]
MGFRSRSSSINSLTKRISWHRRTSDASTQQTLCDSQPAALKTPDDFAWVPAISGHIPLNAVQGGVERTGEPLFICRAYYRDGLHPGRAGRHLRTGASIGYGWQEVDVTECQVLCGQGARLRWVAQEGPLEINGFVPLLAGFEHTGEPLYVAKAVLGGAQQLGKCGVHIKHGASFAFNGREKAVAEYMVLAYV